MRISNCLLLSIFCLAFSPNIQAASTANIEISGDMPHNAKRMFSGNPSLKPESSSDSGSDYITYLEGEFPFSEDIESGKVQEKAKKELPLSQNHFEPWAENILGNVCSVSGMPIAAMGGLLITAYPDASTFLGKVGFSLTALGLIMSRGGEILLGHSLEEAAAIESEMKAHAHKITKKKLSPEKIESLSSEFFGMNETYKSYIGCASKTGRFMGRLLWLIGPAIAVSGVGLMFTGDQTLGPILTVTGAAAFSAGDIIKDKADAYETQQKRYEAVKSAYEKRMERMKRTKCPPYREKKQHKQQY